ncbi:hypothetical protein PENSPDRAFT_464612 [Peniophora sp. CONT]|nr:hypothetical protein PENSPDRAFT_464612 [Peniophora sp. CONT]
MIRPSRQSGSVARTPPSPEKTVKATKAQSLDSSLSDLPNHLARLVKIQIALQHAMAHALATSALAPSSDSGVVRNVLDHHTLNTQAGLSVRIDVDDICRLCWLWEWDGKQPSAAGKGKGKGRLVTVEEDDDNPFAAESSTPKKSASPKDWTRGGMGFVISPTTRISKASRIPAYGLGIEVEMDLDKDMVSGMAAVARWTTGGDARRRDLYEKVRKWNELNKDGDSVPNVPLADLPLLHTPAAPSSLTRLLASASPKSPAARKILETPPSPTSFAKRTPASPSKSPAKRALAAPDFFSAMGATPKAKAGGIFPQTPSSRHSSQTPSSRHSRSDDPFGLLTPRTPSLSPSRSSVGSDSLPSTPVGQRGSKAVTAPETPMSSRRQALMDRIREKSLASPTKSPLKNKIGADTTKMSRAELQKLSADEMRRRVLLGRLGDVAESIWMLFAGPSGSGGAAASRKRKAIPQYEVVEAILKSAPVPLSAAEAQESISILTSLCPFFLRAVNITGEEWLEMPSSAVTPPSPGKAKDTGSDAITRSPRRVKHEGGGLREVRERVRKELESMD